MPSIINGYEYDVYVSYRKKDNQYDGWVTEFVSNLRKELEATFKEDISIYFDENTVDGLTETDDVSESLKDKIRSLVLIPIISQTYCDPKCFAWENEFMAFKEMASADRFGLKIRLRNGNVSSRILPVFIHELNSGDRKLLESILGPVRALDFIFRSRGINRPLGARDDDRKIATVLYRDQINKVANAVNEIIVALTNPSVKEGYFEKDVNPRPKIMAYPFHKIFVNRFKSFLRKPSLPWILLLVSIITLGYFLALDQNVDSQRPAKSFSLVMPSNSPITLVGAGPFGVGQKAFDLSPNGKFVVYVARIDSVDMLFKRDFESFDPMPLLGTQNAYSPTISPDNSWVAFYANQKLKIVAIQGGEPIILCDIIHPFGLAWLDNKELIVSNKEGNQFLICDLNGRAKTLNIHDNLDFGMRYPRLLRDSVIIGTWANQLTTYHVKTKVKKPLGVFGVCPYYLPTGHLFFAQRGRLMVAEFDPEKLELKGTPVPVIDNLRTESFNCAQFAMSNSGTLVYVKGGSKHKGNFVQVDMTGQEMATLSMPPDHYGPFAISPNGQHLAYILEESHNPAKTGVWLYDFDRKVSSLVAKDGWFVTWSFNNRLFFASVTNSDLFVFDPGHPEVRNIARGKTRVLSGGILHGKVNPKELFVYYYEGGVDGGSIKLKSLDGSDSAVTLIDKTTSLFRIDNKERYLAFTSGETGQYEIWITDLNHTDERIQISNNGGLEPLWSPDGYSVYYRDLSNTKIMRVQIGRDDPLTIGEPTLMWVGSYLDIPGYSYDLFPDGKSFLMKKSVEKFDFATELRVMENFATEVVKKVNNSKPNLD